MTDVFINELDELRSLPLDDEDYLSLMSKILCKYSLHDLLMFVPSDALAIYTDTTRTTINNWRRAKRIPRISALMFPELHNPYFYLILSIEAHLDADNGYKNLAKLSKDKHWRRQFILSEELASKLEINILQLFPPKKKRGDPANGAE